MSLRRNSVQNELNVKVYLELLMLGFPYIHPEPCFKLSLLDLFIFSGSWIRNELASN
jgi:hypothetical protein